MDALRLLVTMLPLSFTAGINLYATILIVGLAIDLGWVQNPPAGLESLGTPLVIILAGVMYIVEFVADKVPVIDNAWDGVHTFIRPIGAALMGIAALSQADPVIIVVGALLAGGISLFSHGSKASARVAMNTASPLENVSNIGVSLAEDAFVGVTALLALKFPYLATLIVLVVIAIMAIVLPPMLRWSFYTIQAFGKWLSSLWNRAVSKDVQSDNLPQAHLALLHDQPPQIAAQCKAQNLRGADGRTGYLASWGERLVFSYNKWWASHTWYIEREQIMNTHIVSRPLTDVLEVTYRDQNDKATVVRFVFLKDRAPLAEKLTNALTSIQT